MQHRYPRIASGAAYDFSVGQAFSGNDDLAEETENGWIRLCIHAGSRDEPSFENDGLGTHWLPEAVPKKNGSLGGGASR